MAMYYLVRPLCEIGTKINTLNREAPTSVSVVFDIIPQHWINIQYKSAFFKPNVSANLQKLDLFSSHLAENEKIPN